MPPEEVPDDAAQIAAESLTPELASSTPSFESEQTPQSDPSPDPSPESAGEGETPPPDPEPQPPSWRDAAQEAGFDLSQYTDDVAAAKALAEQAAEAQKAREQLSQYERYIAQQQAAALAEKRQQDQDAPPETPLEDQFWKAPEFNPAWNSLVTRDENGSIVPRANVDPSQLTEMQKWASFQQMEQDRFWQNPFKYLEPYIEAKARGIVQGSQQEYDAQVTEKQKARDIIAQNATWMLEQDPQGQQALTADGKVYTEALERVSHLGTDDQHNFGMQAVELHRARRQQAEQRVTATHQKHKDDIAPPAQRQPSAGGNVDGSQQGSLTLQQMLERDLKAAGITDKDLATNY